MKRDGTVPAKLVCLQSTLDAARVSPMTRKLIQILLMRGTVEVHPGPQGTEPGKEPGRPVQDAAAAVATAEPVASGSNWDASPPTPTSSISTVDVNTAHVNPGHRKIKLSFPHGRPRVDVGPKWLGPRVAPVQGPPKPHVIAESAKLAGRKLKPFPIEQLPNADGEEVVVLHYPPFIPRPAPPPPPPPPAPPVDPAYHRSFPVLDGEHPSRKSIEEGFESAMGERVLVSNLVYGTVHYEGDRRLLINRVAKITEANYVCGYLTLDKMTFPMLMSFISRVVKVCGHDRERAIVSSVENTLSSIFVPGDRVEIIFSPHLLSCGLMESRIDTSLEVLRANTRARLLRIGSFPVDDVAAARLFVGSELMVIILSMNYLNSMMQVSALPSNNQWSPVGLPHGFPDQSEPTGRYMPPGIVPRRSAYLPRLLLQLSLLVASMTCALLTLAVAIFVGSILVTYLVMPLFLWIAMIPIHRFAAWPSALLGTFHISNIINSPSLSLVISSLSSYSAAICSSVTSLVMTGSYSSAVLTSYLVGTVSRLSIHSRGAVAVILAAMPPMPGWFQYSAQVAETIPVASALASTETIIASAITTGLTYAMNSTASFIDGAESSLFHSHSRSELSSSDESLLDSFRITCFLIVLLSWSLALLIGLRRLHIPRYVKQSWRRFMQL